MTHLVKQQFTISIFDISCALGVSRTTLWRLFRGQEMSHIRYAGLKHFVVADVITCLRQRPKHDPTTEITLLNIDKNRRQQRQQEAQQYEI